MPYLIFLIPIALTLYLLSAPPPPPTPAAADHESFAVATALLETHQAALTYATNVPAATGPIPAAGAPGLTTYLPPGWTSPFGITIVTCIGTAAEHRAVATWTTTSPPSPTRLARALAAQSGDSSDAGLIIVNPALAGQLVPPSATAAYTFPSASCPMPTTQAAALVTHTLP